jgi:SAM-dependent methyltransferase
MAEIGEIYSKYEAYYQGAGDEQLSQDRRTGKLRRRSAILVDHLIEQLKLPASGSVLDVGCGSGVTLRAFSEQRPDWNLDGHELGKHNLAKLRALRSFRKLHTGSIGDIASRYDLLTMIHSLEHFPDPAGALGELRPLLAAAGRLFIEVSNIEENPFDILIADHLMHFSPATLETLLCRSGWDPIATSTQWVGKEISATAAVAAVASEAEHACGSTSIRGWARLDATLSWLERFTSDARSAAKGNAHFGVFGTSISGTWLASQLGDSVDFFVDEDASRIGKTLLGRPILSPREVSPKASVFLALTPATARSVKPRFLDHPASWLLPPGEPFK